MVPLVSISPSVAKLRVPLPRTVAALTLVLFLMSCAPLGVRAQAAPTPTAAPAPAQKKKKSTKPKPAPCHSGCKTVATAPQGTAATPEDEALQKQLAELARAVHTGTTGAYEKLSAFAAKNTTNVWGARAALALGYDDYNKNRTGQGLGWFLKAQNDTVLREYALYWTAQAKRVLKRPAEAYTDLKAIGADYPNTAMREQLIEAFVPTAVETGHTQEAIDALNAYSVTNSKPALLLERAHAYQAAHQLPKAAKDYQALYYKFPLSEEAKAAGAALPGISKELGKEYSYPGVEMQELRAQAFYDAKKWRDARVEYEKLLTMLKEPANPARQLAQLRAAESRVELKGSSTLLSSLATPDPEVDAERRYALSQAYRSAKKSGEMLSTIDQLVQKYPQSKWTEEALFAEGNYYWVELDRTKAASYYQRIVEEFPAGKNAFNAEWRVAWVAFLNRQPDAGDKFAAFLKKYPVSANAVDAVYWLGRVAEREGNPAHARSYYEKAVERYPQTYFGHAAAARLAKLGPGVEDPAEILATIPPPPSLRPFDEPIPPAAADRWARAQALRTIAFDASAELELKNAYFATSSPRFLVEAAQAAFDQGHYATGMAYGRIVVPSFDSRKISEVPIEVWKVLYPLPYEAALRREAARNAFDPMFAAGLIRQESTFQADIVSYANAIGLMQVLPKTGKILAKQLKVKYSKNLLFQPDYNLQLGMLYIANLVKLTGAPEYAAAAYNAGEDRIALWKAERPYEEIPELVESIPFTQTREYVQIVLRNAEVYRAIYGPGAGSTVSVSTHSR